MGHSNRVSDGQVCRTPGSTSGFKWYIIFGPKHLPSADWRCSERSETRSYVQCIFKLNYCCEFRTICPQDLSPNERAVKFRCFPTWHFAGMHEAVQVSIKPEIERSMWNSHSCCFIQPFYLYLNHNLFPSTSWSHFPDLRKGTTVLSPPSNKT